MTWGIYGEKSYRSSFLQIEKNKEISLQIELWPGGIYGEKVIDQVFTNRKK
jgi:hypothetical protein